MRLSSIAAGELSLQSSGAAVATSPGNGVPLLQQAKKEQLQEELRNAGVNVELGRKAQERVIELERAIDATQRRAQEMIANLDKLR